MTEHPDPARLAQIRERWAAATPGPWYPFHCDDEYAMNCYGVSTDPAFEAKWDYDVGPTDRSDGPCRSIVALTLYQAQRVVCHDAQRWDADAEAIAHAPDDVVWLLEQLAALEAELADARATLDHIAGREMNGE